MRILMYHTFGFSSTSWDVIGGLARELEIKGFDICRVSDPSWYSRPFWGDVLFKGKLEHLIEEQKPDLIHINSIRSVLGSLLLKIARKHRIPIVATVHTYRAICPLTLYVQPYTRSTCSFIYPDKHCMKCLTSKHDMRTFAKLIETPLYMYLLRSFYRSTDVVISPSALYAGFLRHAGFKNVVHIPNMGNRREFEESASKTHSAWQPFGSILFIGRLSPEKGVILIPAIASQFPDTTVHIVGAGPLSGWLADHNPGNIILHGFISDDQKYRLVSECSLLFLPSIWADLYPTVILEAFTLEKPVVAFDYGGAKEIIESSGGGLLATPFDVGSLAKCIRHLLENPISRKQKGQLAGKWARETVHPDVVIDKFIAIYEHLTS